MTRGYSRGRNRAVPPPPPLLLLLLHPEDRKVLHLHDQSSNNDNSQTSANIINAGVDRDNHFNG
jgi:hypothetical protein